MPAARDHLSAALDEYRASAEFRALAQTTKAEYERILDHLHNEIGWVGISKIGRPDIRRWRGEWSVAGYRAAGLRLQVLKNVLEPAVADGVLPAGLFHGLLRVKRPHGVPESNLAWTDDEVAEVINECLARDLYGLARAVGLGRYGGFRRQTILAIAQGDRVRTTSPDGVIQRRIRVRSAKGEVTVDIAEEEALTELLDDRTADCGHRLVYNARGEPYTERALNQALTRVVEALAGAGVIRPKLTLHGLRHARGVELAYSGCGDAQLMAQLGHVDEQAARVYRRQALRSKLADEAQRFVDARRQRQKKTRRARAATAESTTLPLPFDLPPSRQEPQ